MITASLVIFVISHVVIISSYYAMYWLDNPGGTAGDIMAVGMPLMYPIISYSAIALLWQFDERLVAKGKDIIKVMNTSLCILFASMLPQLVWLLAHHGLELTIGFCIVGMYSPVFAWSALFSKSVHKESMRARGFDWGVEGAVLGCMSWLFTLFAIPYILLIAVSWRELLGPLFFYSLMVLVSGMLCYMYWLSDRHAADR